MKNQDIKTIDILTKTWFDRVNGNTYFAQRITLNFGLSDEMQIVNPFQYGYSSYTYFAIDCINKQLGTDFKNKYSLSELGIIIRDTTVEKCKQRELKNI